MHVLWLRKLLGSEGGKAICRVTAPHALMGLEDSIAFLEISGITGGWMRHGRLVHALARLPHGLHNMLLSTSAHIHICESD